MQSSATWSRKNTTCADVAIAEYETWYYANILTKKTQWTMPDGPDVNVVNGLVEPVTCLAVSNASSRQSSTSTKIPSDNSFLDMDYKDERIQELEGKNKILKQALRLRINEHNQLEREHHALLKEYEIIQLQAAEVQDALDQIKDVHREGIQQIIIRDPTKTYG